MPTDYRWNWAAKPKITELRNIHGNTPIAVVGGGPSAVDGVKMLPKGCIIISANHHAWKLGLKPDYMVFNDNPDLVPQLKRLIEGDHDGAVLLSQQPNWTEYRFEGVVVRAGGDSGMRAVWMACYLTEGPVIMTGMDCYQGKNRYFHDDNKANEQIRDETEKIRLGRWNNFVVNKHGFINPKRIKVTDGLLVKLFGRWKNTTK